ncbi:MAG: hypothetical protein U1F41_13480 [Burkholderiales bacterium]
MTQRLKVIAALLAMVVVAGCATVGGAAVGAGISRASGHDGTTGALIGGGIGMMVDHF